MRAQCRSALSGESSAAREKKLEYIPGWGVLGGNERQLRRWQGRLEDCTAFQEEHRRAPGYRSGTTSKERDPGSWLYRQHSKQARGTLFSEQTIILVRSFPDGLARRYR